MGFCCKLFLALITEILANLQFFYFFAVFFNELKIICFDHFIFEEKLDVLSDRRASYLYCCAGRRNIEERRLRNRERHCRERRMAIQIIFLINVVLKHVVEV